MKEITINELSDVFKTVGKDWLLVGAGDQKGHNEMTASWGMLGELWGKHVAEVFIRPQRYTWEKVKESDLLVLQVLPESLHDLHKVFGSESGRDVDKTKKTGLTPVYEDGYTYFQEAKTVIVLKKLYVEQLKEESFLSGEVPASCYPEKDYHYAVIGEIVKILEQ